MLHQQASNKENDPQQGDRQVKDGEAPFDFEKLNRDMAAASKVFSESSDDDDDLDANKKPAAKNVSVGR